MVTLETTCDAMGILTDDIPIVVDTRGMAA